ncbi:lantibiotic dehydratase C-terminal domain-containing protein [Nonomuraea longicatena]|uniref:Thiopeptide-type bacteriocin biosynthesis domain-containing protein n=1 Tax=Nonomuraea longicatena TaxID=83682 RepID=A0ABN1QF44_9ACTN
MDEAEWVAVHAFYHDDLDHLLVQAVGPLVAELADERLATDFFFVRGWDGGNHLRLRVLPEPTAERAAVEALVGRRLGEFFTARPSTTPARQGDYERMAALLARWERVPRYSRSLYPDNSLMVVPYRRGRRGAAARAVRRHFVESSRIALDLLLTGTAPPQRAAAAFEMALVAWFHSVPELRRLADLVARSDTDARQWCITDADADAGAEPERARAVALARRIRAGGGSGRLAAWSRSTTTLREAMTAAPPYRRRVSSLFGLLDRCARLACNRLGVPLVEEEALRRLAAEAVLALAAEEP